MPTLDLHGSPAGLPRPDVLDDPTRRRRGVAWFLALTFGVSWSLWFTVHRAGWSMSDPVVQLLTAAFVPALAAIVVRTVVTGEGFADSGLRPRLRAAWPRYVVAATLPLVVLACTMVAAVGTGYWRPTAAGIPDPALLFVAAAPVVVVLAAPVYWGEEFGWTGYLRIRLLPGRPVASTLLTGVVWGVWHWPLALTGYLDGFDLGGPRDVAVQLLLWVLQCVLLEIVLTWTFWTSGTVWTTSIVHAGNNLVVFTGTSTTLTDADLDASTVLTCLGLLPVCLYIGTRHVRSTRSTRPAGRRA